MLQIIVNSESSVELRQQSVKFMTTIVDNDNVCQYLGDPVLMQKLMVHPTREIFQAGVCSIPQSERSPVLFFTVYYYIHSSIHRDSSCDEPLHARQIYGFMFLPHAKLERVLQS